MCALRVERVGERGMCMLVCVGEREYNGILMRWLCVSDR